MSITNGMDVPQSGIVAAQANEIDKLIRVDVSLGEGPPTFSLGVGGARFQRSELSSIPPPSLPLHQYLAPSPLQIP